jgi:hypothetical protein
VWTRDRSLRILTRLLAGRPRNLGSIPGSDTSFIFCWNFPSRLCVSPSLLIQRVKAAILPAVRRTGLETNNSPHYVPILRMSGTVTPLSHMPSCVRRNNCTFAFDIRAKYLTNLSRQLRWRIFVERHVGVSNTRCVCTYRVHLLVLLSSLNMVVSWYCFDPLTGKLVGNPNAMSQFYRYHVSISFRFRCLSLWFLTLPVCGRNVVVLRTVRRECIWHALQLRHN